MIRFLYDFVPVLLFFAVYHFYGIYAATAVGMAATVLQVALYYLWTRTFERQQLLTLIIFLIFGSLTLYFHNPLFIKWKPTVLFWVMAAAFFISRFVSKKSLVQRMLENGFEGNAPDRHVWNKLTMMWTVFFAALGAVNIFVAYRFSTTVWVNFKFYGISGLLLLFCLAQAVVLSRYMTESR